MTHRTVLVLLDTPATELRGPVLELLTIARRLGTVEAVAVEAPCPEVLSQLGAYGVELVRRAELPPAVGPGAHLGAVVGEALAAAMKDSGADVALVTSTFTNKESAALAAFRSGAGLVIDARRIMDDDGRLVAEQGVFSATWDVRTEFIAGSGKAIATLRANSVTPEPAAAAVATAVEGFEVPVAEPVAAVSVLSRQVRTPDDDARPPLAEAATVVAGGRGTNGDFGPVFELADVLGAAVGATRDAVYEGWFDEFIGQTGLNVAPRLYVAAGISGAPHHRGGMQASEVIVAVNNDPECPIFEISDFVVVGDLADVLPQAAAHIRKHRAGN